MLERFSKNVIDIDLRIVRKPHCGERVGERTFLESFETVLKNGMNRLGEKILRAMAENVPMGLTFLRICISRSL
jgi:hypothetical protein